MSALLYLRLCQLRNQLRSLVRKPARLTYVLFLAACLGLTIFGGHSVNPNAAALRSREELNAIAAALNLLMFTMTVNTGFSRGGNLFPMSDVNLLFPAPIRPQTLLFYGLLQQIAASLFIGFFLLFQYSNLRLHYGISWGQLLFLLVAYAASVFLAQVTAVLLYALTNGDVRRRRAAKGILYGILAAFGIYVLVCALRDGRAGIIANAAAAVNGTVFRCLPVVGWLSLFTGGILTGNGTQALLGVGLCAAYLWVLVAIIFRRDPDYYEDVLKSAEFSYSAITAKKEGTLREAVPENVRVGRSGFSRGWGADAFFWKHLRENRRSRKFLLSPSALIFALTVVGFALFMRGSGIYPTFFMAAYLQMFSAMTGRISTELTRPYIYLVPEPPMKKLLWALAEGLPSALAESVVIFIAVGAVLALPAGLVVSCIFARVAFSVLYTAASVAVERMWGGVTARMMVFLLFFLMVLVLALPGFAVMGVLAVVFSVEAPALLLTALGACLLPTSLLALFLCRNMLQYAELNQQ